MTVLHVIRFNDIPGSSIPTLVKMAIKGIFDNVIQLPKLHRLATVLGWDTAIKSIRRLEPDYQRIV